MAGAVTGVDVYDGGETATAAVGCAGVADWDGGDGADMILWC